MLIIIVKQKYAKTVLSQPGEVYVCLCLDKKKSFCSTGLFKNLYPHGSMCLFCCKTTEMHDDEPYLQVLLQQATDSSLQPSGY